MSTQFDWLTDEEAERYAHLSGDEERAALLARVIDLEAENKALHWQLERAQNDVRYCEDQLCTLYLSIDAHHGLMSEATE